MKKKLSVSQIRLLLCLIIAAIFSLSYQFVYTRFEDLAKEYENKTLNLKQQIEERNSQIAQEQSLKAETEDLNTQSENIIQSYPVNILKEDDLIFLDELEKKLGINVPTSNINISDNVVLYTTILPIRDADGKEILFDQAASQTPSADTNTGTNASTNTGTNTDTNVGSNTDTSTAVNGVTNTEGNSDSNSNPDTNTDLASDTDAGVDTTALQAGDQAQNTTSDSSMQPATEPAGQQFMTCLQNSITISFQTTNAEFLRVVDYINNYPVKTTISGASLSFDSSTGGLIAKLTINRFALTGTGKVYEEPDIGNISIGTDNLFGTDGQ